jgi:orsellinic acid C2-O-methyltransferase
MHSLDSSALLEMINSAWKSRAVYVAAELRIADELVEGPKSAEELARVTRVHTPSLQRLMRALAALDLCTEPDLGVFALTSVGALLCADAPNGVRSWALWSGKYLWPLWGELGYSVRTGKNARRLVFGAEGFEHLERDREAANLFNRAMIELTRLVANDIARVYDFAKIRNIVDVGGGYGALLVPILRGYPDARGALYDLEHAIEGARLYIAEAGLTMRCECTAGDFFDSVPTADAYLLKSIVHDWDDERSAAILRNCRRAIAAKGKLLLVERILPTCFEASPPHLLFAWADLNMLIGPGGRERTEGEFRFLLNSAGFELSQIVPTALGFHIIEGTPC